MNQRDLKNISVMLFQRDLCTPRTMYRPNRLGNTLDPLWDRSGTTERTCSLSRSSGSTEVRPARLRNRTRL